MDEYAKAKADAMLAGYKARWLDFYRTVKIVGVELEFSMPMINPDSKRKSRKHTLGGKIDLLVEGTGADAPPGCVYLPAGAIAVVEHKTTSEDPSAGSAYRQKLRLDGQVSMYLAAAEALTGKRAEVCIYDVLVKPAIRPLKGSAKRVSDETPAEFFVRCLEAIIKDPARYYHHIEVARLPGEEDEWRRDLWSQATLINDATRKGIAPRNPEACHAHHSTCEFWQVCTNQGQLEDETSYRRLESVNPELSCAQKNRA